MARGLNDYHASRLLIVLVLLPCCMSQLLSTPPTIPDDFIVKIDARIVYQNRAAGLRRVEGLLWDEETGNSFKGFEISKYKEGFKWTINLENHTCTQTPLEMRECGPLIREPQDMRHVHSSSTAEEWLGLYKKQSDDIVFYGKNVEGPVDVALFFRKGTGIPLRMLAVTPYSVTWFSDFRTVVPEDKHFEIPDDLCSVRSV
eukprot:Colp12_sorted_trinity150504_noHs@34988